MKENELKEIKKIIEMTVRAVHKEIRSNQESYCYKNTVLLLENYQKLKDHVEYAISNSNDVKPIEEKLQDMELKFYSEFDQEFLQQKPDLFIESILASRVRTALMVAHIDSMVRQLAIESKEEGQKEYTKFLMFNDIFFEGMNYEEVAEKYHFSRSQVYRHTNDMVEKLSVLLWGMNGLRWLM